MAEFDIIAFAKENLFNLASPVINIACAVVGAIFFRTKKRIEAKSKEFEKVKAGMLGEAAEMLLEAGELSYIEFSKMKNYSEIARRADQHKREHIDSIPYQNLDWHTRFFEACGTISDKELQDIWARILAEEIYQPGSYSLRTLECLHNLSRPEAELFLKIGKRSVCLKNSTFLPRFDSIIRQQGIKYENLLTLEDCGLLKSDNTLSVNATVKDDFVSLIHDDKWILLVKQLSKKVQTLTIPGYPFTASGRELFSAIGCKTDIPSFYHLLKMEIKDFEFALGKYDKDGDLKTYMIVRDENEGK